MAYYKCGSIHPTQNSNVVVDTSDGAIANFNTQLALPLIETKFGVKATQEAGTPTPQSPKAISGVSAVSVTKCGKNLFDKDNSNAILNAYIGTEIVSAVNMRTVLVKCKPNTKYTVSKNAGQRFTVGYTKELPQNNVEVFGRSTNNTATNLSITTGNDALYLVAFVYNSNVDSGTAEDMIASVQIEEGNATAYEAYNGTTTLINLGGTYYGGEFTQDKNGKRQFEVTCAKQTADLSNITPTTANGYDSWLISLNEHSLNAGSSTDKKCSVCGTYRYEGSSAGTEHFYIGSNIFVLYLNENTYRSGTVEFVYPLAEPYTIDLTDGQPIKSFPGVNNIFCDTGDTSVKFRKIG